MLLLVTSTHDDYGAILDIVEQGPATSEGKEPAEELGQILAQGCSVTGIIPSGREDESEVAVFIQDMDAAAEKSEPYVRSERDVLIKSGDTNSESRFLETLIQSRERDVRRVSNDPVESPTS